MDPYDGFRRVQSGRFAYFCEEPTANRVIANLFQSHEICQTITLSFRRNDPGGLILKKLSPFRKRFMINLLWMKEVGIFHKIYRHWNAAPPICQSYGHFESVRFKYLALVFLFLFFAQILSMIILFVEIFFSKLQKCKQRKMYKMGRRVTGRKRF